MGSWPSWLCWSLGGLIAAIGLALTWRSLFHDRSRNRRRCPKCWYDLTGGLDPASPTCPECGREIGDPRALLRTRRYWRRAAAGLALTLAGASLIAFPQLRASRWHAWVPSTALIIMLPWTDEAWPWDELDRRLEVSIPGMSWQKRGALWDWQWRLLTLRCAAALDPSATSATKTRALSQLLGHTPNPGPAAAAVARCLTDPDGNVQGLAAWGIKAARHDWGSQREMLIQALKTAPGDSSKWGRSKLLAIKELDLLQPPADSTAPPPAPDEIVSLLNGATTRELAAVHQRLGVFSRMLTWAYDGESGPLRVKSYDLELDGEPGLDCVVRIGDAQNTHNEMLLFLRRGDSWRSAGLIGVANQVLQPPEPRSEQSPDGRVWLVIRACAGSDGGSSYMLRTDSWFNISERDISLALSTAIDGYHRGRKQPPAPPLAWELSSESPHLTSTSQGSSLQYAATIEVTGVWPGGWKGLPTSVPLEPAASLFRANVILRFRWDQRAHEFKPEPSQDPWIGPDGVVDSLLGSADDFFHAARAQLVPIAKNPSAAQRAWLRLFLNQCTPSPERDALLQELGPEPTDSGPDP